MRKANMKKLLVLVSLVCLATAALLAEEAAAAKVVFSAVSGKVEYQRPGSAWKPAKVGDSVEKGTIVSTGFKSSATLKLDETALYLKPLTRLTLEDLIKTSGGTQTKLYLLAGRVKADVPPQAGKTTDFHIKSPTATASVRGTEFEFDGMNLMVSRGTVQYQTPTNQYRLVGAREFSYIAPNGTVTPPATVDPNSDLSDAARLIDQSALGAFAPPPSSAPVTAPAPAAKQTSTVTITVQ
jgi:hypothetical protein